MDYYNHNAKQFYDDTRTVDLGPLYERFLVHIPKQGTLLDAGCGSARDATAFSKMGYRIVAFDASPELVKLASRENEFEVSLASFQNFHSDTLFDGIWACASLLHVPYLSQKQSFKNLFQSLKPDGVFYASYKLGDFEGDRNGRFFCDMNEARFDAVLNTLPAQVLDVWETGDQRVGRQNEKWFNVIIKKT